MINRDGGVWRLSWEITPGGYRAWVIEKPRISVEATTWEEVERAIVDAVDCNLQAGEWAADWEPPPPAFADFYRRCKTHIMLVGNAWWNCWQEAEALYRDGRCPGCHTGMGGRTDALIQAKIQEPAHICIGSTRPERFAINPVPNLWSEELVEALTPEERATAEWRPAERSGKGRRRYLEPLPRTVVSSVGIKTDLPVHGYRCTTCSRCYFHYETGRGVFESFFCLAPEMLDLPTFWVSHGGAPSMCIRTERWKSLRTVRKWRGVFTNALNLVDASVLDPDIGDRLRQGWLTKG